MLNSRADVVISGAGLVAAPGPAPEDLHRALCRGEPLWTAGPVPPGDGTGDAPAPSAPVAGFNIKEALDRRGLKDLSRTSQFACAAAARAAGALAGVDPEAIGVVLGTGWGSLTPVVDFEWETCTVPPRLVDPLLFAETVSNVPAGQVSIQFGWSALNLTMSGGSASGLAAIGEAIDLLAEGRAAAILAGGADALNRPALRVLAAEGILAADGASRPFGKGRTGPAGGEGACFLVLESGRSSGARGVTPLASVRAAVGCFAPAALNDAGPAAAEIERLLRLALRRAELEPEAIGLVVASADGSPRADRAEAQALDTVFGASADRAPIVIAPKGILGETWGASGPLGAVAAIECLRTGRMPGAALGFVRDPELPGINLPPAPVEARVRHALVLATTGGGHLQALVLSAPDADRHD